MLTVKERLTLRLRGEEFRDRIPEFVRRLSIERLPDPYDNLIKVSGGRLEEFLFVHVPKTAGTSLCNFFGVRARHIPLSRYYAIDRERAQRSLKVAVVRDPVERLHSAFNYLHSAIGLNDSLDVRWATENLSSFGNFAEFLDAIERPKCRDRLLNWIHFFPQTVWLLDRPDGEIAVDALYRFENLSEGMSDLQQRLGLDIKLGHSRRAHKSRNPSEQVSQAHRALIREIYCEDYLRLGY